MCMIIFSLLSVFVCGEMMSNADGVDFEDTFAEHNPEIWKQDKGTRHCGPMDGCVWARPESLTYTQDAIVPGISPIKNENAVRITMRNDCSEAHCCEKYYCTSHTSGHLTSKHLYPYGSFWFKARPSRNPEGLADDSKNALSCFGLRRILAGHDSENVHLHIMICFQSQNTRKMRISAQYGDRMYMSPIALDFDAADRVRLYRIDWHPDFVKISTNGKVWAHLKTPVHAIPDVGLYIKMFVIPHSNDDDLASLVPDIEHKMYVHKVKFMKYDITYDRTELFHISKISIGNTFMITFASALVLFAMGLVWWLIRTQPKIDGGYDSLINEKDEEKISFHRESSISPSPSITYLP